MGCWGGWRGRPGFQILEGINTVLRHSRSSFPKTKPVWLLLFFLIHRKDKIRPSPAHPGNTPPPFTPTPPISRNSTVKKYCHNIYRHAHYGRLSLYFGEEIKFIALNSLVWETKIGPQGVGLKTSPHPGGLEGKHWSPEWSLAVPKPERGPQAFYYPNQLP